MTPWSHNWSHSEIHPLQKKPTSPVDVLQQELIVYSSLEASPKENNGYETPHLWWARAYLLEMIRQLPNTAPMSFFFYKPRPSLFRICPFMFLHLFCMWMYLFRMGGYPNISPLPEENLGKFSNCVSNPHRTRCTIVDHLANHHKRRTLWWLKIHVHHLS